MTAESNVYPKLLKIYAMHAFMLLNLLKYEQFALIVFSMFFFRFYYNIIEDNC